MDTLHSAEKKYELTVTRETGGVANVSAHGVSLHLSMNGNDPTLGFTAPETVLAGYGACLMTNLGKAAQAMGIKIDDVRIELAATKRDEPLGLKDLRCKITVKSGAPEERVRSLFETATTDGTATNAIHEGFRAAFELARE